ncbi:hypothetical protein DSCW_16150 [Desulfosarcina widdelii]|uniref:DUF6989 domain-containing protein n=2 Tax=Desulfosarcina widdelii TaxID=947919 RepID=A0A5K7YZZ6_9BACT|nr:hypothetical protein DSCW_16150 [Desulfosarcina widdelii]
MEMMSKLTPIEREALFFHLLYSIICVGLLALPLNLAAGVRLFILVILYNIVMPVIGLRHPKERWFDIWLFSLFTSLFQVLPDWFLSAQLGVLVFPEDGLFKIGVVSGYMAGLWTIPFFMIIFFGKAVRDRYSSAVALWAVAGLSLLIFGASEETMWRIPSWYAVNVTMIGHIAVYLIVPEIILGLSVYLAYEFIRVHKCWLKVPAAFLVMQLYTGSLSIFYFLIEEILIPSFS